MITKALALVLVLTVIQLGQGIAMRLEIAPEELARPAHIGLGVLTALVVLGLARSNETAEASCCRGHNLSSGITFVPRLDGPIHTCRGTGIGFNPSSALLFRNCLGGRKPCSVIYQPGLKRHFMKRKIVTAASTASRCAAVHRMQTALIKTNST
jgi:hypothetical protein